MHALASTFAHLPDLIGHQPLLLLGLATIIAYYFGGAARRLTLPSLLGFMALGVILGPSALGWFSHGADGNLEHYNHITEIALGFVAFAIGSELSLGSLRRLGAGIILVIFTESLTALAVVTGAVYLITGSLPMALLFGAVAPASAPAGTVAVIQEYRARGSLTKALYAVVGFDDGLAILLFGLAAALAKTLLLRDLGVGAGSSILSAMVPPLIEIVASLVIGTVIGYLYCFLVRRLSESRDMMIITFGTILLTTGLCTQFHLSLILTNMVIGFVLVNTRSQHLVTRVMEGAQALMPLLFVLFFCLAGAHLDLIKLPSLGLVGVVYVLARSAGLMGGAYAGAAIGRMEPKIRRYLGLGILSQAGVAIGLCLVIQTDFAQLADLPAVRQALDTASDAAVAKYDPRIIGAALITTITATCIVFEIVGPILTKIALTKAGEIPPTTEGKRPLSVRTAPQPAAAHE